MKLLEVKRSALCDYAVSNMGPALLTDVVLLHGSLKSDPEREIYIYKEYIALSAENFRGNTNILLPDATTFTCGFENLIFSVSCTSTLGINLIHVIHSQP